MLGARVSLAFLLALSVVACSDGGGKPKKSGIGTGDETDGGETDECIDLDDDGYGKYCGYGLDCDDHDPEVTDECRRCVKPNKNCPCDLGELPVSCKPKDIQGDGGVYQCSEGSRYCRDGYWSDCEAIGDYVFVAGS